MEIDNSSPTIMEETKSIFKRASKSDVDKKIIYNALQDFRTHFEKVSLNKLEDLMFYMLPCVKNLFFEIYRTNEEMDSERKVEELLGNLTMTISLTNFIEELLNLIASQLEYTNLNLLKTMILEIPKCIFLTYNHCKGSQKKYQNVMNNCKEILLLYKKNQECHMKFLNIISLINIDSDDENSTKILIETIQSISNITEVLFGLNIKALADSWKSYCCVIEKHQEILAAEKFYCIREIELLEMQIHNFMNIALESNDDKQVLQYSKLSGFLLKVALKIIIKFWQYLSHDHLECIHKLACSIYIYSPEISDTYMLTANVKNSVQVCLLDVITSFVEEKLLQREILKQMLSKLSKSRSDSIGCLEFNMKILDFINHQTPDSLDYSFFASILNLIFYNFSIWFPDPYSEDVMNLLAKIIEKLSSQFSKSIEVHNSFYNEDFESLIFSNILGNHIGCHILASTTWVQIISKFSFESKKNFVTELLQVIDNNQIELSFSSLKVIFLKKFMHKLFNLLDEEEIVHFLNLYPPLEYKSLWRIIGLNFNTENEIQLLNPLFEFLSLKLKDMKNLTSAREIIESVEALKIFAGASNSILEMNGKALCDIVLTLWELNFEEVPSDNIFLKYFISCLSEVTVELMNYFSIDQIVSILKRMEILAINNFFKVKLCLMLSGVSTKQAEHHMEQNKLNFLISDLFEILLRENDKMIKEVSLKIFQQFAYNNHFIIVNNVSRMLPDMNLEQYLRTNGNKMNSNEHFHVPDSKAIEHKCLVESRKSISAGNYFASRENSFDSSDKNYLSRESSFETESETMKFINRPSVEIKKGLTIRSNGPSQCKRVKLNEDVDEENDSISDVLQRIKSEIKCLNKILSKEKPTPKNVQDIKMLACQIQNLL